MDEDCFHPCYNTEYTMHCPVCLNEVMRTLKHDIKLEQDKERLTEICGKCQVPPKDDPALSGEFREYVPRPETDFKPEKTYEVWKEEKLAAIAKIELAKEEAEEDKEEAEDAEVATEE